MRKTVSLLLVVIAAASTFSIHEAAAQSRSDKGGRTSSSFTHGGSGENRENYRYVRLCMPNVDGSGKLYADDMRGWRRVSSCNGYQLLD